MPDSATERAWLVVAVGPPDGVWRGCVSHSRGCRARHPGPAVAPTYGVGVIVLIATYRGKPGTGDTIEPLLAELAAATRVEPGCLLYLVNRSTTAADTFVLYEHYVDEDALAAHRDSPHFQRIGVGQVIPMLEERVFDVYRLVEDPPA